MDLEHSLGLVGEVFFEGECGVVGNLEELEISWGGNAAVAMARYAFTLFDFIATYYVEVTGAGVLRVRYWSIFAAGHRHFGGGDRCTFGHFCPKNG